MLSEKEYGYFIKDSGASIIISSIDIGYNLSAIKDFHKILCSNDEILLSILKDYPNEFTPHLASKDEIAFMLYSSGSTGKVQRFKLKGHLGP